MGAREDLIAFGRACGDLERIGELAAKRSAPLVETESKRTAAAGTDPDGTPWPLKKDGSRALVNAADHVTARAAGAAIIIELRGHEPWHQDGAQGKPVRRVIPDGEIPAGIAAAVDEGCTQAFEEIMGAA